MDIADIVRAHRSALEASCRLTRSQKRVLTDIAQCRTAVLGGHLDRCLCGYEHPSYNSCRNRHCPKCQALVQERWIETRRERMLDVRHFHVVFTLPAELRPLAAFAPVFVFEALFQAAQRTLLEFGKRRLGATIGATLVLHTWWNVYAKVPFNKGRHVLDYLGRYTHRVGLANSRLLAVSEHAVTFRTKGTGTETFSPVAFLRRFVQHVLPDGLHKIRHVGLYASPERGRLARQRLPAVAPKEPAPTWRERFRLLTGRDLSRCPHCGGLLVGVPLAAARDPPGRAA